METNAHEAAKEDETPVNESSPTAQGDGDAGKDDAQQTEDDKTE